MLRKIVARIVAWFRADAPRQAETVAQDKPKAIPHAVMRKPRDQVHFGAHYYLGDLLKTLKNAFADMPKLRKADPDMYDLLRQVGVSVTSGAVGFFDVPEPAVLRAMPSFGGTYILEPDRAPSVMVPCRFLYYVKEKSVPRHVEHATGSIYRIGLTYTYNGHSVAGVFRVEVSSSGRVRPLKEASICVERPAFRRRHKMDGGPQIPHVVRDYPVALRDLAKESESSVEDCARRLFAFATNLAAMREAGLTVHVKKGREKAAFAIDMERTPYFFADRDKTVTENGATKKIFHIVRAHKRTMASGETRWIKMHFRGLQSFTWNGYAVDIKMAGKHGHALSSLNFASVSEDIEGENLLTASELGERVAKVVA